MATLSEPETTFAVAAQAHLAELRTALADLEERSAIIGRWGGELAERLVGGGRLLTVGNGGSAAHAEHLSAEFVGRYQAERLPFSAVALHVDGATLSALANDYGAEEMFARQVRAHGRPGDVLIALSTSGRSPNILRAVEEAVSIGMTVWSLTGKSPNPVAATSHESLTVATARTATVQEIHQVAIHLLCDAFDRAVGRIATAEGALRVATN